MGRSQAVAARTGLSMEAHGEQKKTLIFISGIAARSGTTYLQRLLITHPDICRPKGPWELPLFDVADKFADFHASFLRRRKPGRLDYSFEEFAGGFGEAFMRTIEKRVPAEDRSAAYILHKNPSTVGIEYFKQFFPDAKLIFIVRDGRDNVNSLLAATGFRNSSCWSLNRLRHLYVYARFWARSARRILGNTGRPEADCLLVRYEELHQNSQAVVKQIADYSGLPVTDHWLKELANVPVKGSNFYGIEKGPKATSFIGTHTNWKEMPKTDNFNPIGRWRSSWSVFDKLLFEKIAGREMKDLGYLILMLFGLDGGLDF